MSISVIKVENLSKQYRLGNVGLGSLSHDLNRWWYNVRGKEDPYLKIGEENDRSKKGLSEYVWALKDINFEVKQGEVLGIIGRNGAGKSTLLKILSRTTTPTTGQVKIKGRVASLLEVGTGFHPELTGRENIFLNGAILGMSKQEIKSKFDEIVDFSGVERYIDTPVKRYSSGMYVRLAFAVAAHLDPEILIIDEVLAVGDAEFQKKALGKMKDVSIGEGRTVLFVSHNMQALNSLTNMSILLKNGIINSYDRTDKIIEEYLKSNNLSKSTKYKKEIDFITPKIISAKVITSLENGIQYHAKELIIEIEIFTPKKLVDAALAVQIFNLQEVAVTHFWLFDNANELILDKTGNIKLICTVPNLKLFLGTYNCTIYFSEHSGKQLLDTVRGVCSFDVVMYNIERDYEWQAGSSTYVDNFAWSIKKM